MGDDAIDDIFHSLKVIASIRENERINTSNGGIAVSSPGHLQGPLRWWYRQTRDQNINDITRVFQNAFAIADNALQKEEAFRKTVGRLTRRTMIERLQNWQLIRRTQRELDRAAGGVGNLEITYKRDANAAARIRLLRERIDERLALITESLKYMNDSVPASRGKACERCRQDHGQPEGSAEDAEPIPAWLCVALQDIEPEPDGKCEARALQIYESPQQQQRRDGRNVSGSNGLVSDMPPVIGEDGAVVRNGDKMGGID